MNAKRFNLFWFAAFIGLFVFNGSVFAQETFCYEFNFANNSYPTSLTTIGSYETDLGTGDGYYTSVLQSDGNYKLSFSYNPFIGIGFYGRITRASVNISYPIDSVTQFNKPSVFIQGYGFAAGWNSVATHYFLFTSGSSPSDYIDFNQPMTPDNPYVGTLYAQIDNPEQWANGMYVELNNNISGTKITLMRFEGTGSNPFGSNNCDPIPNPPTPTPNPTNDVPPTQGPTNTPTATYTPSITPTATSTLGFAYSWCVVFDFALGDQGWSLYTPVTLGNGTPTQMYYG
jgi:hypothetical protein